MDVDQDLVTRPDSLDPGLGGKQTRHQSCGAERGLTSPKFTTCVNYVVEHFHSPRELHLCALVFRTESPKRLKGAIDCFSLRRIGMQFPSSPSQQTRNSVSEAEHSHFGRSPVPPTDTYQW